MPQPKTEADLEAFRRHHPSLAGPREPASRPRISGTPWAAALLALAGFGMALFGALSIYAIRGHEVVPDSSIIVIVLLIGGGLGLIGLADFLWRQAVERIG